MEIIYRNGVSIDYVRKELHYCQEAQSWNHGTRSSWTFELEEILKAAEAGDEDAFDAAVIVAEAEARKLATEVAQRKVDIANSEIREYLDMKYAMEVKGDTLTDAIATVRSLGRDGWIHDDIQGARDGYVIDDKVALAYASCRSLRQDDTPYVEKNLLP